MPSLLILGQLLILKSFPLHRDSLPVTDYTFANLETVIGCKDSVDTRVDTSYSHIVNEATMEHIIPLNLTHVALCNNHVMDCGPEGIKSTITWLQEKNIGISGIKNIASPVIKILASDNDESVHHSSNVTGKVVIISMATGSLHVDSEKYINVLESRTHLRYYDLLVHLYKSKGYGVIIMHHYHLATSRIQTMIARTLIDSGADLYVSNGKACVGDHEIYRDKYIFYNLGSYIFQSRHVYPPIGYVSLNILVDIQGNQVTVTDLYYRRSFV
jgi:poly-gamma-glutamate capsule biosynthesis protein CapA/YwtB (metallophosphatase superfamily)